VSTTKANWQTFCSPWNFVAASMQGAVLSVGCHLGSRKPNYSGVDRKYWQNDIHGCLAGDLVDVVGRGGPSSLKEGLLWARWAELNWAVLAIGKIDIPLHWIPPSRKRLWDGQDVTGITSVILQF
jgi:hypothetical protein